MIHLAMTYHDPGCRLLPDLQKYLPVLKELFLGISTACSAAACPAAIELFHEQGAEVRQMPPGGQGRAEIGKARRAAVELADQAGARMIFQSDCDRLLHWIEHYPEELKRVAGSLPEVDYLIFGRTERAYGTHPRVQRDTEAIANRVFQLVTGKPWDVLGGARRLSHRAAEWIVRNSRDDGISSDVSWPLLTSKKNDLLLGYQEVEGLEFETGDRYPDEVHQVGGQEAWKNALDQDPRQWAVRLKVALAEVDAMIPFWEGGG